MKIRLTSVLTRYTDGVKHFDFEATTVRQALNLLDNQFPGIKFRFIDELDNIRPHMNIFLNQEKISSLDIETNDDDELFIVQSLSGGLSLTL